MAMDAPTLSTSSLSPSLSVDKLFDVRDKNILITGGGTGIGRMIAQGFVDNGKFSRAQ
jgi:predicted Rossmann-fold nucleotide-binding protein